MQVQRPVYCDRLMLTSTLFFFFHQRNEHLLHLSNKTEINSSRTDGQEGVTADSHDVPAVNYRHQISQ